MINELTLDVAVLLLYMVPSSLYCLYNNLSFVNLAAFDPATYFLLLQLRVVVTGIIFQVYFFFVVLECIILYDCFNYVCFRFQVVFKKQLSTKQWISLVLLTVGCMIKQLNLDYNNTLAKANFHININIIFIFIQVCVSSNPANFIYPLSVFFS